MLKLTYDGYMNYKFGSPFTEIDLRCLHKEVTAQVHTMCREWNRQLPPFDRPLSRTLQSCSHAIKNTRRKMEDRHIILSDLNTLFNLQVRVFCLYAEWHNCKPSQNNS